MHMYERQCVLGADVQRACQRRGLKFGLMKRRRPLQVPLPRCHPGTRTLTVIGDCVLHSLHASPSLLPPLLCSTFIWPHSPLLAFNAEPGSTLIKVKASQCLDETEKEKKRGMGWCGRAFGEKPDEKSEKRLYLCTIAALRNTDEAGRHFTYLARRSAPLVILTTSMSRHPSIHMARGQRAKQICPETLLTRLSNFFLQVSEASVLIFCSFFFFSFFARRLRQN